MSAIKTKIKNIAFAESAIFRVSNRSNYFKMVYCRIQRAPAYSGFVIFPSRLIPQGVYFQ